MLNYDVVQREGSTKANCRGKYFSIAIYTANTKTALTVSVFKFYPYVTFLKLKEY